MRDQLIAFGIDHARAPVALRERLAISGESLPTVLAALADVAQETLILSTCNRLEVYALFDRAAALPDLMRRVAALRGLAPHELDAAAIVYDGQDAAAHLFRVACGLESMVLGEPQILAQVRDALAAARRASAAGPILSRLATDALRVGKRARTETDIARNRLSLPHAAVDLAAEQIGGLTGRTAVVVGAGKIGALTAKLLREARVADLVIANRTPEHGLDVARRCNGRYLPLAALPSALQRVDAIFAAVSTRQPVIDAALAPEIRRLLLAVDLGVPRNIAPSLRSHELVRLFDVDDLQTFTAGRRASYEREIRAVEALVAEAVADFGAWWAARDVAPTIAALRERGEAIRSGELDRALRKLGHLSERDRDVVAALSVGIVNKLLHEPVTRLKATREQEAQAQSARAIEALFGLGVRGGDASPAARDR